jgi:two-component sensor histidine kinase
MIPSSGHGAPTPVSVSAYLQRITEEIVSSLPAAQVDLDFADDANCYVDEKTAEAIGIIAGEWVSNAVKYAHPAGVPGRIELASSRCPDGSIEIQVSDDGIGLPDNFDPASKGHEGFRLVQKLADQLGALLRSDSDELGLCMTLHIPAELAVWIESLSSRKHQGRRL